MKKAKTAKSADELFALAKENGIELNEEQAAAYYAQLHPVSGEMSDDELENVAGGGCNSGDGRLVVTAGYKCLKFVCKNCGFTGTEYDCFPGFTPESSLLFCPDCAGLMDCGHCKNCTYENGLLLCNNKQ